MRLRIDFEGGTLTDNPLLTAATTANSPNFSRLPVIAAPDFMLMVLDPDGDQTVPTQAPEVVKITAHAASATSVTISRAYNPSYPARDHAFPAVYIIGFLEEDFSTEAIGALNAALYFMGETY